MKKLTLLFAFLLPGVAIYAQTSGAVYYHEKTTLHINIQGDAPPPPNLPRERNAFTVLYFQPDQSLYVNDPDRENDPAMIEHESIDGNEGVHIKMSAPDDRFYCDLKNSQCIDQRDFMQRLFLVERDLRSTGWKITGHQKSILNYPCQEATLLEDGKKVTAWFTTAIPVSAGPATYGGLPGLVLEVSVNDGDRVISAVEVKPGDQSAMIRKPKEGKKVTEAEFNKIREDKLKEMGVENGSGGNVIIRINDR